MITRVGKLTDRLDALYGTELDSDHPRTAAHRARQLDATIEALTGLPDVGPQLSPLKRLPLAPRGGLRNTWYAAITSLRWPGLIVDLGVGSERRTRRWTARVISCGDAVLVLGGPVAGPPVIAARCFSVLSWE